MTPEQIAHFERRLQDERARLLDLLRMAEAENLAGSASERAGDLSQVPHHNADVATDAMQRELEGLVAGVEHMTLGEIDAALDRLYRTPEQYGLDERTGAPIPLARLEVIPWARFGIDVRDDAVAR